MITITESKQQKLILATFVPIHECFSTQHNKTTNHMVLFGFGQNTFVQMKVAEWKRNIKKYSTVNSVAKRT